MDDRCFACGRKLGINPVRTDTRDGQTVFVGRECAKLVDAAGDKGWQPPKGGPRLYPLATPPASPQAPAQSKIDNQAMHIAHCGSGEYRFACKYGNDDCPMFHDAAPAQQAVVGEASEQDHRLFDMTLECIGRAVEVTFDRKQISALVERLSAFGLLAPSPAPSAAPHQGADALREALTEMELRTLQMMHVRENARRLAAADEYREQGPAFSELAAAQLALAEQHRDRADVYRSAALAQHQAPPQGEQHE